MSTKNFKQKIKHIISGIITLTISITILATFPALAEENNSIAYEYDGYSIEYSVKAESSIDKDVEIKVTNTGDESILNWALRYDAEGEISDIWNAQIYDQQNFEYVIKSTEQNFEILPGESIVYGYILKGEKNRAPKNYQLNSKRVDLSDGYDILYNITDSWDTGFKGELVIKNTSDTPIEAWALSLESNFIIDNLSNGRILENNETYYKISSETWSNSIQPHDSIVIGFYGTKISDIEAVLNNFSLSAVIVENIVQPDSDNNINDDLIINAEAFYDADNNIININWLSNNTEGLFNILISYDGVKFTTVGSVKNQYSFVYVPENSGTIHIKVQQIISDIIGESNELAISCNINKETIPYDYEQLIFVDVESDYNSLKQITHSSAATISYKINSLVYADKYIVTCFSSNAGLLSKETQYVSTDNPTFDVSFKSMENGMGLITVQVEAVTNKGTIKSFNNQKIFITATSSYDYISINNFRQSLSNCLANSFKCNEITAIEYIQALRSAELEYDNDYINSLIIDYIATQPNKKNEISYGQFSLRAISVPVTVKGTIQWTDDAGNEHALKNTEIEIVDYNSEVSPGSAIAPYETLLKSGCTDENGNYSVVLDSNGSEQRPGGYDIKVKILSSGEYINVTDSNGITYKYESEITDDIGLITNTVTLNPIILDGNIDAIKILQAGTMAAKYTEIMNKSKPNILNFEYPNNSKNTSYYNNGSNKVFVNSNDYYDWDIIQHEYGHYVQNLLGTTKSPGGTHYYDYNLYDSPLCTTSYSNKDNAVKLAWGEGWADYFAVSLQKYMKAYGGYNNAISHAQYPNKLIITVGDHKFNKYNLASPSIKLGEANELAVASVLYNLENSGALALSNKDLWDIVKNNKMVTLSDLSSYLINSQFSYNYSKQLELGSIFNSVYVSPTLQTLYTPSIEGNPPTFKWFAEGGSQNIPNNSFQIIIYDYNKTQKLFESSPINKCEYTPTKTEWSDIGSKANGKLVYWVVKAYQTNSTKTGPYYSNSGLFGCKYRPDAPAAVSAVALKDKELEISWSGVSGADGYEVYCYNPNVKDYVRIATTNNTKYTHSSLDSGKLYYYQIRTFKNVNGLMEYSSFTPEIKSTTMPEAPTSVSYKPYTNSITIVWERISGVDGYEISRATSLTGTYSMLKTNIYSSLSSVDYTDSYLSSGAVYYYKIRSFITVSGNKLYSDYTTIAAATIPKMPDSITTTAKSTSSIALSWSSISGASGYEISRAANSYGPYSVLSSTLTSTSYTDSSSSLSSGVVYYYKIRSYVLVNGTKVYLDYATVPAATMPKTPTSLKAKAESTSSIYLNWDYISGVKGYEISRATSLTGTYTVLSSTLTSLYYTNSSLSSGVVYYYKVRSYVTVDGANVYSDYATVSMATLPKTPVTAVAKSTSSIALNWDSISGVSGYEISRATSLYGYYSVLSSTLTSASYTDSSSLSSGVIYYYNIRSYITVDGTKVYFDYATASMATMPKTPTSVKATAKNTSSIDLSWDSISGVSGYEISRATSSTGSYSVLSSTLTSASYTDSSLLSSGVIYYYKIRSYVTVNGTKVYSDYATTSTATIPKTPASVTATAKSISSIAVSWGSVSEASGYEISRATSSTGIYSVLSSTLTSASYTDSSLSNGTAYYYKIRSFVTVNGTKVYSDYATTSTVTMPKTPTSITATAKSTSSIALSWGSISGVSGYEISRATSSTGTYSVLSSTFTSTSYTDSSLTTKKTYYYKIRSYVTVNSVKFYSDYSTVASATTN